jgi:uncharacterized protein
VSPDEPLAASDISADAPPQPAEIRRLLDLQELDLAIDRLRSRLADLEAQDELRQARSRVGESERGQAELQLSIDAVAREQRRLESDVDSMDQKIEAERKREFDGSVANPKELQSIEHEVENLRGRKTRLEDDLLDKMEEREQLETRLPAVQAEVSAARERLAEIERMSAKELVDVERELADRSAERAVMARQFSEELLDLYDELRQQKKGVAVVRLEDGVCGGCHQKLSPMYLDRLKRTEGIRRCEYCRRMLVLD